MGGTDSARDTARPRPARILGELFRAKLRSSELDTQAALAQEALQSRQLVSDLMTAARPIPWERVETIARALDTAPEWLAQVETQWRHARRAWRSTAETPIDDGQDEASHSATAASGPCPSTLPADPRVFVGRDSELRQLLDAPDPSRIVSIHAIAGMAGAGKTTLAVRAAHELAPRFPDGRYFVRLHAYSPSRQPADPAEVLGDLLLASGMDPAHLPDTFARRRDRWRALLSTKRVLLVLDDAVGHEQIEPLLPSGADCLTIVTSRHRLTVADMRLLALGALAGDSAVTLFLAVAGRDSTDRAEQRAGARIAEACGYLPLAIAMIAGQVAHHRRWTAADIAERATEIESAVDRIAALDEDAPSVRAAFDLSFQALTVTQQRLFGCLGSHPGREIDAYAAAALTGTDVVTSRRELLVLHRSHLLEEVSRGRYRMHDLLRDYSRGLTGTDGTEAVGELLGYYQRSSDNANHWSMVSTRGGDGQVQALAQEFDDQWHGLTWLRAERNNLLDCLDYVANQVPERLVALTTAVVGLLWSDGPLELAVRLLRRGAETAGSLDDRRGQAEISNHLGFAALVTGDTEQAIDLHRQALDYYRDLGHQLGVATASACLGEAYFAASEYERAREAFQQALDLYRRLGNELGEANAHNGLGATHFAVGENETAKDLFERALLLYRSFGSDMGVADALNYLGATHFAAGEFDAATDLFRQALAIFRRLGHRGKEAGTIDYIGAVHLVVGDYPKAADLFEQALGLHRELGNRLGQNTAAQNLIRARGAAHG
ncbi:tetratricopeptide repeat protein [Nocardia sp. NPDC050697]|uniref:tetratricopeptide repeat protein n=1 Tax=Nocardia sp. NPDC050697 TaxID=3155158 RepID=UPI003405108E